MSCRSDGRLTHDQIKRSLAACAADECHGQHTDCALSGDVMCMQKLAENALRLIADTESALAWERHKMQVVVAENTALLADLRDAEIASCDCLHCKHYKTADDGCAAECDTCKMECVCKDCCDNARWEWRGVQEY